VQKGVGTRSHTFPSHCTPGTGPYNQAFAPGNTGLLHATGCIQEYTYDGIAKQQRRTHTVGFNGSHRTSKIIFVFKGLLGNAHNCIRLYVLVSSTLQSSIFTMVRSQMQIFQMKYCSALSRENLCMSCTLTTANEVQNKDFKRRFAGRKFSTSFTVSQPDRKSQPQTHIFRKMSTKYSTRLVNSTLQLQ